MSKKLVAYFSASGVTAGVAKKLAKVIGADIYEIAAKKPYTEADLNWQDKHSRSSVEMDDRTSRPAIGTRVENMEAYDTVCLGFPIWWYREPSIIDTFMESYDFNGKTIILFCTSGGSSLGDTAQNIQKLAAGATVKSGERFPSTVSEDELKKWAESVGV